MAAKPLSGWLEKKGEVNTGWKKRWCDLRDDCIEYRKKPADPSPRGVIALQGATVETLSNKDGQWQNRLGIRTRDNGRLFELRGSLAVLTDWQRAIEQTIARLGQSAGSAQPRTSYDHDDEEEEPMGASAPRAIPATAAASSSRSTPAASTPPAVAALVSDKESHAIATQKRSPAILDGWLEKKGENRRAWKDRWFELREARIDYFKSPADAAAKDSIRLRGAHISVETCVSDSASTAQGMAFLDISPADTLRTYRMRAEQAVIAAWKEAVEGCVAALATKGAKAAGGSVIVKGSVGAGAVGRTASAKSAGAEQQQQQQQQAMAYADEELSDAAVMSRRIAEREQAMGQLESDMATVNSMFKDVANLVSSQNDQISSIEQHIDETVGRVDRGMGDLTIAHKRC